MAIDTASTAAAPPTTSTSSPEHRKPRPGMSNRDKLILFVLCAAQFMVALDFSVLNVALPVLGSDLGMSTAALQWGITAFALPSAGFLLLFGRVADLYGRRRIFLTGLALFGAASLLATFAWDPASFLAGRALQGVGAAAIVPTGMALLTTTFAEGPARDRALGISGTLLSLGFTVGMVAGGVLTDALGWRSTMGLLTLFTLIVLPLAPGLLRESRVTPRPRLDIPGAITVTTGLLSVIYALSTAAEHGFAHTDVIATLIAGILLLAAFTVIEAKTKAPLISLPMLRRRTVAWGNLGGLVTFSMMTTVVFVLTLYLQDTLHLSPFQTGLVFGVPGLLAIPGAAIAPKVIGRFGAPRILVGSLLGQGALIATLLTLNTHSWSVWIATAAVSLAAVFHLGAIISYGLVATSGIPNDEQGLATSLVTSTQQVGITVGIPLLGVLATTAPNLLSGVHLVLALDAAIVLAAAVLVAVGLRVGRRSQDAAAAA